MNRDRQYLWWLIVLAVAVVLFFSFTGPGYEGFTAYTLKNGPNGTVWAWPQSKYGTLIQYDGPGNYLFGW